MSLLLIIVGLFISCSAPLFVLGEARDRQDLDSGLVTHHPINLMDACPMGTIRIFS